MKRFAEACMHLPLGILFGLISPASLGAQTEVEVSYDVTQPLPPDLVEKALGDCCWKPLNLSESSDPFPGFFPPAELEGGRRLRRGLVLTPYHRVALRGDSSWGVDAADVADLLAPELWIVAFPYSRARARALLGEDSDWTSDPMAKLDHRRTDRTAAIFWPRKIVVRTTDKPARVIEPLWVETVTFPFTAGLTEEWIPKHSVVAAFPLSDPAIASRSVRVDLVGEESEGGQTLPDESSIWLTSFDGRDWLRALHGKTKRVKKRRSRRKLRGQ